MKGTRNKTLRKLLCSGLIIAMVLFNSIAVFAIEDAPEDQNNDGSTLLEMNNQEEPQEQPASSSETAGPELSELSSESVNNDAVPDQDGPADAASANTDAAMDQGGSEDAASTDSEEVPADIEEQPAGESGIAAEEVAAPSEPAGSEAKAADLSVAKRSAVKAAGTTSAKKIHIGDTTFDSGDDESSDWSDGKGWRNVAGQYVAMVDFDGSGAEISADEGVVTLAVAGVNRIGTLKGNCSYNIVSSGIVLIDSIEIEDGNDISLMPNTAVYDEGSAAVFLLQDDGTYLLINGSITGILDETYALDGVDLVVPDGSSLKLSAMCIRTETWVPEGSEEPVTDVTYYMTDMPDGSANPVHTNGVVRITDCGSRLVIGENSTLTIDDGASVLFNKLKSQNKDLDVANIILTGELIVQGAMNVIGTVSGGYIDVQDGGSLSGTGTVKSAEVDLQSAGSLDIPLEESTLTVYANADGSKRAVDLTVKDSTIYLRGTGIDISNLNVSGSSTLSIDTRNNDLDPFNKVGNIEFAQGGNLDVTINKYDPSLGINYNHVEHLNNERDGLTDSYLEIYGGINGGTVSVLAGFVKYTGAQSDTIPEVPDGYASRVLVKGTGPKATLYPLNMNEFDAGLRASLDEIPVIGCIVSDAWETEKGMFRVWTIDGMLTPLKLYRSNAESVTYPSLLGMCGLLDDNGQIHSNRNVAVELIYSDFSRSFLKADDRYPASLIDENTEWPPIPLDDVIMVRVMQYMATGSGFGGSSATHTVASVTGTGAIGSPGAGSMKAGNGAVIYRVSSAEPEPVSPAQEPSDLVDPTQEQSDSSDPSPAKPDSVDPAPKKTAQVNPNSKKPDNDSSAANNLTGSRSSAVDSGKTVSTVNDAGWVVSVTPQELTSEYAAKHPDVPQIWQLSIRNGRTPVTDLSGTPIKVTFPFTIPESWGDPAATVGDLYAVFADDDELTAYKAEYDPVTKEISFETDKTGNFVIVQLKYEGKPFTEEFYKALAELKEVKDFLAVMKEEQSA